MLYNISYKTFMGTKPLHTSFDKIDGFIRIYDETRYLVLFDTERYDENYNRIKLNIL